MGNYHLQIEKCFPGVPHSHARRDV